MLREREKKEADCNKRIFQTIIYSCTDKQSINKIEQNHNDIRVMDSHVSNFKPCHMINEWQACVGIGME